jgi:hypothetical protein
LSTSKKLPGAGQMLCETHHAAERSFRQRPAIRDAEDITVPHYLD